MRDEVKVREAIGRTAAGRRARASAERLRGSIMVRLIKESVGMGFRGVVAGV